MQQYLPLAVLKPNKDLAKISFAISRLQQYLPLAVLKLFSHFYFSFCKVATVLTACGIETYLVVQLYLIKKVATVLTACGIETAVK